MTPDPKGSSKTCLLQAVLIISFLLSEETSVINKQGKHTSTNTHSFTLLMIHDRLCLSVSFSSASVPVLTSSFDFNFSCALPLILPVKEEEVVCVVREHFNHQCNNDYFIYMPFVITVLFLLCLNIFHFLIMSTNSPTRLLFVILLGWFQWSIHYVCLWALFLPFCLPVSGVSASCSCSCHLLKAIKGQHYWPINTGYFMRHNKKFSDEKQSYYVYPFII